MVPSMLLKIAHSFQPYRTNRPLPHSICVAHIGSNESIRNVKTNMTQQTPECSGSHRRWLEQIPETRHPGGSAHKHCTSKNMSTSHCYYGYTNLHFTVHVMHHCTKPLLIDEVCIVWECNDALVYKKNYYPLPWKLIIMTALEHLD